MAIHMIPEEPKDFDPRSHEDVVFNALKNNYSGDDEYYVFHSYNAVAYNKNDNTLDDRDLDFVIANGIIVAERRWSTKVHTNRLLEQKERLETKWNFTIIAGLEP